MRACFEGHRYAISFICAYLREPFLRHASHRKKKKVYFAFCVPPEKRCVCCGATSPLLLLLVAIAGTSGTMGLLSYAMTIGAIGVGLFALVRGLCTWWCAVCSALKAA